MKQLVFKGFYKKEAADKKLKIISNPQAICGFVINLLIL